MLFHVPVAFVFVVQVQHLLSEKSMTKNLERYQNFVPVFPFLEQLKTLIQLPMVAIELRIRELVVIPSTVNRRFFSNQPVEPNGKNYRSICRLKITGKVVVDHLVQKVNAW